MINATATSSLVSSVTQTSGGKTTATSTTTGKAAPQLPVTPRQAAERLALQSLQDFQSGTIAAGDTVAWKASKSLAADIAAGVADTKNVISNSNTVQPLVNYRSSFLNLFA